MASDGSTLDYQHLIRDALRDVVRRAMEQVAEHGLPGEHHFYLSFRTEAEGVSVPQVLSRRYPEEITVVLQNQYWGLEVDEEGFSVTLAFDGSRQPIAVPWEALTAFVDPAAELALRFGPERPGGDGDGEGEGEAAPGSADPTDEVVNIRQFRKKD